MQSWHWILYSIGVARYNPCWVWLDTIPIQRLSRLLWELSCLQLRSISQHLAAACLWYCQWNLQLSLHWMQSKDRTLSTKLYVKKSISFLCTSKITFCHLGKFGVWTSWEPWSFCSASCGGGARKRKRDCAESNFPPKATPETQRLIESFGSLDLAPIPSNETGTILR